MANKKNNRKLQKEKVEKLLTILDFLVLFNLFSIPMYVVLYYHLESFNLRVFESSVVCEMFKMLGYSSVCNGDSFIVKSGRNIYTINVSWDSTGWKSMYAFFSLVMATPVFLKRKYKILAAGEAIIFFSNLIRIFSTVWISLNFGVQNFGFIHSFLWREGMIFIVLAIWGSWLSKQKNNIGERKYIIRWLFGHWRY